MYVSPQLDPDPSANNDRHYRLVVLFLVLFVSASLGGYFAYKNIIFTTDTALRTPVSTFAMRPYSVTGSCAGGEIVGNKEQTPYTFDFTFILASQERSFTFTHSWSSHFVDGHNVVDDTFSWSQLDARGSEFSTLIRAGDRINWTVTVRYAATPDTLNETYTGFFVVSDAGCAVVQPTPIASTTVDGAPSPSPLEYSQNSAETLPEAGMPLFPILIGIGGLSFVIALFFIYVKRQSHN